MSWPVLLAVLALVMAWLLQSRQSEANTGVSNNVTGFYLARLKEKFVN